MRDKTAEINNPMGDGIILLFLPKRLRKKTKLLLSKIKHNSNTFTWNSEGQLICNGNLLSKVYITDVLQYILDSTFHYKPRKLKLIIKLMKENSTSPQQIQKFLKNKIKSQLVKTRREDNIDQSKIKLQWLTI
jgi:hypothetical protein